MKIYLRFMAVLPLAVGLFARADETFDTLTVGKNTYTKVTITAVTTTDIYFTYSGGMGNAKLKNLSPELKQHFHYNEARAAAVEQKQAQGNAQYLLQMAGKPDVHPPDESRQPEPASVPSSPAKWNTDFPAALNEAKSENKPVLLDFTGSDWCQWCMKFDQEVLSTPQFAAYAQNKLVLVKVDFPNNIPLSEAQRHANKDLATQYNASSYPTLILVDASGNELGRQVGYVAGGPDAFIAKLDGWNKK